MDLSIMFINMMATASSRRSHSNRAAALRQKRSFVIFGFGKYGDARIFSAGMGFPDTKWIEQIFEVGGD